jgi:molybdenum cofactor cytidylyltransferase
LLKVSPFDVCVQVALVLRVMKARVKKRSTLVPMPIPAIILAAGASRRLGQPKQLVRFEGETLLERALRLAKEAGAAPVVAVLGAHFEAICASISFEGAIPVLNLNWQDGMSTSIRVGLNEAEVRVPGALGVLLMACDQPQLSALHLRALLAAFEAQQNPSIIASAYAGVRGIPAVFPRIAFHALRLLNGDKGARNLIEKPPCDVIALAFEGGEVDIDLPSDLAQLH